jgi:hypothetical protein
MMMMLAICRCSFGGSFCGPADALTGVRQTKRLTTTKLTNETWN